MKNNNEQKAFSNIGTRSFILVVLMLCAVLFVSGALSYFIPQGSFERNEAGVIINGTYTKGEVEGIAIWRIITAPVRVFASEDALTVIMISVFLLIMSGVFNLLEKTGGLRVFIGRLIHRLRDKGGPVVCLTILMFMLFGSFFGMFEELVTLLPLIIMFMLSMGMDTMTGLGACMLAACFGFSAAITNPFSVGTVAQVVSGQGYEISAMSGAWLRIVFFGIVYFVLCTFMMLYLRKIERNPKLSLTYEIDLEKRRQLDSFVQSNDSRSDLMFRSFGIFFGVQALMLVLIASIRAIAGYAIPILAASFLIGGIAVGLAVTEKKSDTFKHIINGAVAMLPAVVMIAIASSVKLVMTESGILETVMHALIELLYGKSKILSILLIYLIILVLQIFIGSASAKILLVMPIIMPISMSLGLSAEIVILAYCMADGFTDVIIPTNPVLLVGLSMANVSYGKWVKWTWKLQTLMFLIGIAVLFIAVGIGY